MIRKLLLSCFLVLFSLMASAQSVKLAVTDLVGLEELQREFGAFVDVLSEATGYDVEFLPVTNRTAAVEALRFKKVDFVLTGPAEYVVMKKRTDAKIVVGFSRPDYFAVIVSMADKSYTTPADLKGQKIAFGSVGSTSKHLGPMQALADYNIDPLNDIKAVHTKMPVAWESLKRGDVSAVGMNHLKFLSLRDKEMKKGGLPPGAFRVIARGPDLPNDLLMAGPHVNGKVIATMKKAFIDKSDSLVAAILKGDDNQKYKGMQFLGNIEDKNYNYVRNMYATVGYPEYADFIGD